MHYTIFSLITGISWLVLIVYWVISSPFSKRSARGVGWWRREIGIRLALIAVIFLLFKIGALSKSTVSSFYQSTVFAESNIAFGIIGAVLCVAGVAFAIWARAYLGRNWGMPMTLQEEHKLITLGPYTFVRHPIYTGFFLAMLGTAFADGIIWLIILIFAGIYFIYSATVEEKIMLKQFPDEYPAYMRRTKMFIPFLL